MSLGHGGFDAHVHFPQLRCDLVDADGYGCQSCIPAMPDKVGQLKLEPRPGDPTLHCYNLAETYLAGGARYQWQIDEATLRLHALEQGWSVVEVRGCKLDVCPKHPQGAFVLKERGDAD